MTNLLIKLFIKNRDDLADTSVREKYGTFSSIVGIILNAILAAMKMIVGIISGSLAILADGINNLSDAGSHSQFSPSVGYLFKRYTLSVFS